MVASPAEAFSSENVDVNDEVAAEFQVATSADVADAVDWTIVPRSIVTTDPAAMSMVNSATGVGPAPDVAVNEKGTAAPDTVSTREPDAAPVAETE